MDFQEYYLFTNSLEVYNMFLDYRFWICCAIAIFITFLLNRKS